MPVIVILIIIQKVLRHADLQKIIKCMKSSRILAPKLLTDALNAEIVLNAKKWTNRIHKYSRRS